MVTCSEDVHVFIIRGSPFNLLRVFQCLQKLPVPLFYYHALKPGSTTDLHRLELLILYVNMESFLVDIMVSAGEAGIIQCPCPSECFYSSAN